MHADRKAVWGWALYDWANSAFATTVMAGFFPVFFKQYWSARRGRQPEHRPARRSATRWPASPWRCWRRCWAPSPTAAAATQAPAPALRLPRGRWRPQRSTGSNAAAGSGPSCSMPWASSASRAPTSSTTRCCRRSPAPSALDTVSSLGYALGYLGGGLLFLVNVLMATRPEWFGIADGAAGGAPGLRLGGGLVGRSSACSRSPGCRSPAPGRRAPGCSAPSRTGCASCAAPSPGCAATGRSSSSWSPTGCYIDGVDTIIRMAVDYGLSLGLPGIGPHRGAADRAVRRLPGRDRLRPDGASAWGRDAAIFIGIAVYMGVTVWGTVMPTGRSSTCWPS